MGVNFEFFLPVRVKFGQGMLEQVGTECTAFVKDKILLVVDQNLIDTIPFNKVAESLKEAGLKFESFSDFSPNPDEESIERGLERLRNAGCRALIGLGGGSAMDAARAIGILATVDGAISQYEGINTLNVPILPLVNIPTTAGTGSEVSSTTVITNNANRRKYIIKSPLAFAKAAILDPETLTTLPKSVAASSGMDAVIHAVESFISRNSSSMSEMFAKQALRLAAKSLRTFFNNRMDIEAASDMLLASMLAAVSMSQAGLGVVHALANTLGGQFHSPHGLTCSLLLSECLQMMIDEAKKKFAEIAQILSREHTYASESEAAHGLPNIFRNLMDELELKPGIAQLGVTENDLSRIVENTSTVVAGFSPRQFTANDMIKILKSSM